MVNKMRIIYILYHRQRPLYFSENKKDLKDYCLEEGIEENIIEVTLVPTMEELKEEYEEMKEWRRRMKNLRI
jgi:hypothetical protein